MNSLLDDDDDDERPHGDREVTLGTGTILAIFFGLVLLCGVFFGFGYKMGSHSTAAPIVAAIPESSSNPNTSFNNFKPAAGSPVGSTPAAAQTRPAPASAAPNDDEPETPAPAAARSTPAPVVRLTPATAPPAASQAAGTIMVQVAAFTHQEDADLLVHALKAKGYSAFERSEPQDKLLHIQVGPYSSRQDAETAKQRLLSDGYQPLIK